MKVTAQLLHKLEACPNQVELFSKLYPDGVSYTTQAGLQRLVNKASKQGLNGKWFIEKVKLSCTWKEYYGSGQIWYEWNYKNGKLDNVQRAYYKSGQLEYEWSCKDGKRDGVWRRYCEDGQLDREIIYKSSTGGQQN